MLFWRLISKIDPLQGISFKMEFSCWNCFSFFCSCWCWIQTLNSEAWMEQYVDGVGFDFAASFFPVESSALLLPFRAYVIRQIIDCEMWSFRYCCFCRSSEGRFFLLNKTALFPVHIIWMVCERVTERVSEQDRKEIEGDFWHGNTFRLIESSFNRQICCLRYLHAYSTVLFVYLVAPKWCASSSSCCWRFPYLLSLELKWTRWNAEIRSTAVKKTVSITLACFVFLRR